MRLMLQARNDPIDLKNVYEGDFSIAPFALYLRDDAVGVTGPAWVSSWWDIKQGRVRILFKAIAHLIQPGRPFPSTKTSTTSMRRGWCSSARWHERQSPARRDYQIVHTEIKKRIEKSAKTLHSSIPSLHRKMAHAHTFCPTRFRDSWIVPQWRKIQEFKSDRCEHAYANH